MKVFFFQLLYFAVCFGFPAESERDRDRDRDRSQGTRFTIDKLSNNDVRKTEVYNIKVGLLFPKGIKYLKPLISYETTAGAVGVALERIRLEQILPFAKWSFVVRYTDCVESVAIGEVIPLLQSKSVDAIIGPPCSVTALVVAALSKYYDLPMISWAATSTDLANVKRFPTLVRVIGSSLRLGRALKEVLVRFDWKRIAVIYTDDGGTRKCYSIAEGLRKIMAPTDLVNVYNLGVDRARISDEEIDTFLKGMAMFARIAVVCLEHEGDTRRFMMKAHKWGLSGKKYVYMLPDYVRDMNKSETWTDYTMTGLDAESQTTLMASREGFKSVLYLEMLTGSNEELHFFKKKIVQKIKEWPFFYNASGEDEKYGSLYSPFLHDAMIGYAYALNKTFRMGGKINEGSWIMNNTKNTQFSGISGHVVIDDGAEREPNFVIRTFDRNMKLIQIAEALMYKADGKTINLLVPERVIWEIRDGFVPVAIPVCGFSGEKCLEREDSYIHWILIGIIGSLFMLAGGVTGVVFYVRRKLITDEMAKMLWKVAYREIVWLNDKSRRSKSLGSLKTISTNASDDTADAIMKGEKNVAHLRGMLIWAKQHQASMILSGESDHNHMKQMRDVSHENLNMFIGLCIDAPHPISVWKYNSKGSLEDVIHNDNVRLDWFFKYSLFKDIVAGIAHLHESGIKTHGHLKSANCVVDNRWVCKITDYGLFKMRSELKEAKDQLWTAPEFLRMSSPPLSGSQKGDVYSFAIIIQELLLRDRPYANENLTEDEIIGKVTRIESPPFRPSLSLPSETDVDSSMLQLMQDCWKEDPELRPDFKQVKAAMRQMGRGRTVNLLDHVLKMMEKYAGNLEQTVNERTKNLTDEMKKSDLLLYRMLPKSVADKLKAGQSVDPETFESVTLFFSDVVGFAALAAKSTPMQIVNLLNELYTLFDDVIAEYDAYKVETIGDGYMCGSGLPIPNGNKHASEVADMALQFIASAKTFYIPHLPDDKIELRVGCHSGPCVAGVVGLTLPRYCLFGDTVFIANKMESTGKGSCIQISEQTNAFLTEVIGGYLTKPRGEIIIKGKGVVFTYWLLGKSSNNIRDQTADQTSGSGSGIDGAFEQKTAGTDITGGDSQSNVESGSDKTKKKKAKKSQVQPASSDCQAVAAAEPTNGSQQMEEIDLDE